MNANIFLLLSSLWLVDDSAAVGFRHVWTRDQMMCFGRCCSGNSSVVQPDVTPVFSRLLHVHSWTTAHLKPWTAQDVITLCSSHSCLTDPNSFVLWKTIGSAAQFSVWQRSLPVIETMTLFSGLGTDVHFSGDETGLQWEDYLFELQNAVEWRMVMSRGRDERSQMHATSLLLNTCNGMTNRVLTDDGARWILQGDEQERENRTAGVKALYSMLASTTSGSAKRLVKQGLSDRNGMIAFGRIRERFGKTAGVAKLSDVFQFQWTSSDSLQDMLRQVNMTSLGDDARETLTIAGQGTISGTTLTSTCSTNLDGVVCKRGSVLANNGGLQQSAHANGNWCRGINVCLLWQSWTRESEVSIPQCEVQQLWQDWTSQNDMQTT